MPIVNVVHDSAHQRFLVRLPEGGGELVYRRIAPHTLELVHTEVAPALRGRGVGEALAQAAIAYVRAQGMRIVPSCPYIQSWLVRHPEHGDLVVPAQGA
ncbi:MAG TPA: GNAT family N-acetyltransferase [Casimicrobiaceae bacterium]|nr:GNAT family N-acetyltransferase [Casimicrobiaceae bacterium]